MRALIAVAVALSVTVLAGCEGRRRSGTVGTATAQDEPHRGPSIAVLDLSEGLPEQPAAGFLALGNRVASFDDLVREAERLAHEREVRGILVRLGTARIGLARATEVGAVLATLGKTAPVWCHADGLGNDSLYLAARGCTRVWVSPAGSVDAIGLAAQLLYFHKLLAVELGLDVDFLQVGKYKGAQEPFTRDGPSPEARASLESTLADLRTVWLDGIHTARPSAQDPTPEDGPYSPNEARTRGLVDEVGYFDDARNALQKRTGAARAQVRFGQGSRSGGGEELSDLLRELAGESLGEAPVALVRADGAISMDGEGPFGGNGIVERRLVRVLARLAKDDDVKAVVVRIDSPGGSALASDLLWHELMRVRAEKPLVVSIGEMAASGGYYLASAGSVIFADETSIVGSIGVVGGKIAADHALEKIGVHAETIPAKVGDSHAAARAAYESLLVPWDDATRVRLLETMTGIYDLFLARVAEGRGIPIERVTASAEGRVFSGRDGKARGLVDELGGLMQAVARARTMAGLPADARVGVAGESTRFFDALSPDEPSAASRGASMKDAFERVVPELAPYVAGVAPIAQHEHVVCTLPFALTVH